MEFIVLRAVKIIMPLLGMGEGITAPVLAKEKWQEINEKIQSEGGKQFFPMVKEMFNMPVEDAVDAAKLAIVVNYLFMGPEMEMERVVFRNYKCPNWEWYNECEVDPEFRPCDEAEQAFSDEGYKAINPKLTGEFTKAKPRGDPYCETVIEFKEE